MPPAGLIDSLNAIRELSIKEGRAYHQYVPELTTNTNISDFATPILEYENVRNDFMEMLLNKIVYSQVENKVFNNPFNVLEGEVLPMGYAGEEIYINPVNPVQFDPNDFAGLLEKYETDAKVQYTAVNSDLQYCLSISYDNLRKAMVSWNALTDFINAQFQALYNGAFITRYNQVRRMVAAAYKSGRVNVEVMSAVTNADTAKALITKARSYALNFRTPSSKYNAWANVGGYGPAVMTWVDPENVYLIIRNDILATTDVEVLAAAFNMDKAQFVGHVIGVEDFNIYDEKGELVYDGSAIQAIMCDKSWFRIRQQQFRLNQQFIAKNEVWQAFLRDTRMVNYSLFANAVVFATSAPEIPVENVTVNPTSVSVTVGGTAQVTIATEPFATTDSISVSSDDSSYATASLNDRTVSITGVAEGSTSVRITVGSKEVGVGVVVTAA